MGVVVSLVLMVLRDLVVSVVAANLDAVGAVFDARAQVTIFPLLRYLLARYC